MPFSKLDILYRSVLLTKYFIRGWGEPNNLKRLLKFRKLLSIRGECYKLVPEIYPISISGDYNTNEMRIIEGNFISPFNIYFPDLLPTEVKKAHFQILLPREWKSHKYKPVCLHMAGTGDHFFWRRRELMAKPLLNESGVGSIIIENPFYGLRKPKSQVRSILHHVSDIFVMGGCLIMESFVLFHWCLQNGLGPLGVTGISMGGHMASLAAASWPYPIVLVPCLSWSTASGVFTEGVMSKAINWDLLDKQFKENQAYKQEVISLIKKVPGDELFLSNNMNELKTKFHISQNELIKEISINELVFGKNSKRYVGKIHDLKRQFDELKNNLNNTEYLNTNFWTSFKFVTSNHENHQDAIYFMKDLMDSCTHLSNYPIPCDTSLIILICALHDAYVPRDGVTNLLNIWPNIEVRYLDGGHIAAFLLHQNVFRNAIAEGFHRYIEKYM